MRDGLVLMRMAMFSIGGNRIVVCVLVVFIMQMFVMVFHHLVCVYVLMTFGEMQPGAYCHQHACDEEWKRERFAH